MIPEFLGEQLTSGLLFCMLSLAISLVIYATSKGFSMIIESCQEHKTVHVLNPESLKLMKDVQQIKATLELKEILEE